MEMNAQMRAPVYEALEKLKKRRVVPFDVPGHKRGRGNPELVELLGEKCVSLDVNSMKPLRQSLSSGFGHQRGRGTCSGGISAPTMRFLWWAERRHRYRVWCFPCCKAGDKIILPRNVHKSVINALVLCGAIPVYVNPEVDTKLGISLGMKISEVEQCDLRKSGGSCGAGQ